MEINKYVYFIESHESFEIVKLYFSKHHTGFEPLEIIDTNKKQNYDISIYRFKFYPRKIKKNEITIKLEYKKHTFESVINNFDMNKDTFLFKIKFEAKGLINKKAPPKTLNITMLEMFNYYFNYLKNNNLDKSDLISCAQKTLEQYPEFDIKTYLTIFIECSTPVSIQRHLDLYKQNFIIEGKNLDDDTKQKFQKQLNLWEMSPETKLKDLNKEREEENKFQLYSIILYFNYLFNKNRIKEMTDNKQVNEYIFKI